MEEEADFNTGNRFRWVAGESSCVNPFCYCGQFCLGEASDVFRTVDDTAKKHGEEHQMIILDPYHSAWGDLLANNICELHIGLTVCIPVLLVEIHLSGVIMEQWPKD